MEFLLNKMQPFVGTIRKPSCQCYFWTTRLSDCQPKLEASRIKSMRQQSVRLVVDPESPWAERGTLWRVVVSRLSPALDVGMPHVGWTTSRQAEGGVVTAYVTSLETTARLFPAVCAACQLSLVRSNAWHLTAQLLVPAKLLRATVWHVLLVTEPRRKSWFETLASGAGDTHCRLSDSLV